MTLVSTLARILACLRHVSRQWSQVFSCPRALHCICLVCLFYIPCRTCDGRLTQCSRSCPKRSLSPVRDGSEVGDEVEVVVRALLNSPAGREPSDSGTANGANPHPDTAACLTWHLGSGSSPIQRSFPASFRSFSSASSKHVSPTAFVVSTRP